MLVTADWETRWEGNARIAIRVVRAGAFARVARARAAAGKRDGEIFVRAADGTAWTVPTFGRPIAIWRPAGMIRHIVEEGTL